MYSTGDFPRLVTAGITTNGDWWGAYTYYPYPEEEITFYTSPNTQAIPLPEHRHELGRCKYCGIKHDEEDKYCEACGAPL